MKVDDVTELPQHQAAAATRLQACRSLISRTPRNEQQLLASQRVLSFFAGSFLSTALSSIDSADGFFSLQFSSSSSRNRRLGHIDAAILGFQLYGVASQTACLSAKSAVRCPSLVFPQNLFALREPDTLYRPSLQQGRT